jgi:transmembrane sensor
MSPQSQQNAILEAAAAWFASTRGSDLSESDWTAFCVWLERDPRHRAALGQVERLWVDLDLARELDARDDGRVVPLRPARPPPPRPRLRQAWAAWGAAAAGLAICVAIPPGGSAIEWRTIRTPVGQTRSIALADGSRIDLGVASEISVGLGSHSRAATLGEGEAAFSVAHDPRRPFLIRAGDRQIRVLGTEFDVKRRAGKVAVTVRRGRVAVEPTSQGGGEQVQLTPRERLEHLEGALFSTVSWVEPDDAFAWRDRRLVYRQAPLAEVAADLSRYFARPVHVAPDAALMRFTGVLQVDREEAMVGRLEAFLPITAHASAAAIRLSAR